MKSDMTLQEFLKALAEIGVSDAEDRPWNRVSFTNYLRGDVVSFTVDHRQLGRCYSETTSVTLNGTEAKVPKGNFGNHKILAKGEHPLLGAWIKSSCEYDSSD